MPDQEMGRVLSDIRERMVRVETKIDNMTDVRATAEEARETANIAVQSPPIIVSIGLTKQSSG
ncbi:hypothetical protein J31TS6_15410 [Brevibacillus reuszeri]|nr:hypothetical protein J31TS6_15410 [Brevibacillus reuszeri]